MSCPRFQLLQRIVGNNELPGEMDRVGHPKLKGRECRPCQAERLGLRDQGRRWFRASSDWGGSMSGQRLGGIVAGSTLKLSLSISLRLRRRLRLRTKRSLTYEAPSRNPSVCRSSCQMWLDACAEELSVTTMTNPL